MNPPELTVKSVLLGIVLSMVLASSMAYLGLFAGMTISASIPAAVVSMGILRLCRKHTIFENNIVQTAASAGECLAAGVLFAIPLRRPSCRTATTMLALARTQRLPTIESSVEKTGRMVPFWRDVSFGRN